MSLRKHPTKHPKSKRIVALVALVVAAMKRIKTPCTPGEAYDEVRRMHGPSSIDYAQVCRFLLYFQTWFERVAVAQYRLRDPLPAVTDEERETNRESLDRAWRRSQ